MGPSDLIKAYELTVVYLQETPYQEPSLGLVGSHPNYLVLIQKINHFQDYLADIHIMIT